MNVYKTTNNIFFRRSGVPRWTHGGIPESNNYMNIYIYMQYMVHIKQMPRVAGDPKHTKKKKRPVRYLYIFIQIYRYHITYFVHWVVWWAVREQ